jgi:hypothetical protein
MLGADKLIKELRETVQAIGHLPTGLLDTIMAPVERFRDRRERLRKQTELAELRELIKILNGLMISKGSLVAGVRAQLRRSSSTDISWLREDLERIPALLEEARDWLLNSSLSSVEAAAQGAQVLGSSQALFRELAALPDDELFREEVLLGLVEDIDAAQTEAHAVFAKVDAHRQLLDHSYG